MLKQTVSFAFFLCLMNGTSFGQVPWLQNYFKKWEVSISGGTSFSGDKRLSTPVEGTKETRVGVMNFDAGYLFGVRITENLGQHFGAEPEYSFANKPLAFIDLSPAIPRLDVDHQAHNFVYSIAAYLKNRTSRLRPFLAGGIGATFFVIGGNSKADAKSLGVDLKNQWKFAFSAGGGIKYLLSERFGFRVDARNLLTGTPDFGLPRTHAVFQGTIAPALRPSGNLSNWQVSAGIFYHWNER